MGAGAIYTDGWHERDRPDFMLSEEPVSPSPYGPTLQLSGASRNSDADIGPLNASRQELHAQLEEVMQPPVLRFYGQSVRRCIEDVIGAPALPVHRIATEEQLVDLPAYNDAVHAGAFRSGPQQGYYPLLGVASIERRRLEEGEPIEAFDTMVRVVGRASLTGPLAAYEHSAAPPVYLVGGVWRSEGTNRGELLREAAVAHLSALVRQRFGLVSPADDLPAPLPGDHFLRYLEPAVLLAAGVKLINEAAGFKPRQAGFFEPLWEFQRHDGAVAEAARSEMHSIIKRATGGSHDLRLEHLEDLSSDTSRGTGILRRIEEACRRNAGRWPRPALA